MVATVKIKSHFGNRINEKGLCDRIDFGQEKICYAILEDAPKYRSSASLCCGKSVIGEGNFFNRY